MNLLEITTQTWISVGIVAGIFAGSALLIGVLILVVGKIFKVNVDEKVVQIMSNLAGANCGGCGCSGCSGFACKLAEGKGDLNDCHVTSPEGKAEIAKILGIELSQEERTVACVMCNGGENCHDRFDYNGLDSCAYCASIQGGNKSCSFACLGCGDCVNVCPENAISIQQGRAVVDGDKCVSCGACITACPKNIIKRIPALAPVYVSCSSKLKGKEVMSVCKVGCIGCGLCAKNCPHGAITMVDNLPVFDYSKCTGCQTCVAKCPRKIILVRDVVAPETPTPKVEPIQDKNEASDN